MNYLIYPLKTMNITQSYHDNYTHLRHTQGNLKDYPIDDACGSNDQAYFYCPCDEMIVKKIYGVGLKASNTVWLESTTPVVTPLFTDYITMMIVHMEDKDLKSIRVGQKFSRYAKMFPKGSDGNATGPHFHIAVGRGKFVGSGWKKNNLNLWIMTTSKYNIKPEEAFFIDDNFTKILNNRTLNFVHLYTSDVPITYYTTANLNIRYGAGTNYKVVNTLPKNTQLIVLSTVNDWAKIGDKEYVNIKYLSKNSPKQAYMVKHSIASFLNVRNAPNGKIINVIPKNTTVANMKEKGLWTQIYPNRWVYTKYLN